MLLKHIDDKIRRAFSDSAVQYDVLTGLHKEIGRELLVKAAGYEGDGPVLDVGIGTGWFTGRLKDHFPDACVVGLDSADGMIEAARRREEDFRIVQADAGHLPFGNGSFDLVISNLAYQWVGDLSRAFAECQRVLKSEGKLHLTMFGHHTFQELFEALDKTRADGKDLAIARLAGEGEITTALNKAGFRDARVEEEVIRAHFSDMTALVKWVKDIGANALVGDMFIGRDWLARANAYYNQTFGDRWGVSATFQVIWVSARK